MEKSKLLQLLNCLSAWELRNLEQFLRSPFHNQRADVLLLLEFYRKQRNKRKPDFSDTAAIRAVWPGKAPGTVDYPNLRSYLFKLVEKYLAVEEILGDEFLMKMRLGKVYGRLKKSDNFDLTLRNLKDILQKQPLRNPEHLRRCFELEYELLDHDISRGHIEANTLNAAADMLDAHYFAEKLKLACAQVAFLYVRPGSFDSDELRDTVDFLRQKTKSSSYLAIEVYYHAYLALSDHSNKEHFEKVRQLLRDAQGQFTQLELGDICRIGLNYCIRKSNQGIAFYAEEGLELYRFGIEQDYLLLEGYLPHHTYINAVAFGISLGKYDWSERFIEDYKNKVAREHRENAYIFCLARLRYAQGNYREAMPLLASFVTDYPHHFLIAKKMLCKIFYEQDDIDPLKFLLASMRAYLQRQKHKMDKEVKGQLNLFITLMTMLMKWPRLSSKAKARLLTGIDQLLLSADKEWFRKQLKELGYSAGFPLTSR